jgi:hypothetical protein
MIKISTALVVSVMILSITTPVMGEIIVETRPFGIDPETFFENPDGWLDISKDDQIIGIYLTNTGASTLTNVQATFTAPAGSNIVVTSNTESFGDLPPGVSRLGFFEASFGSTTPNKYDFTLDITGDGYSGQVTTQLWVAKTYKTGNKYVISVPEGTLTQEFYDSYGGVKLTSLGAPTSVTWIMEPSSPFAGTYAPLPFSDPWWKVAGFFCCIAGAAEVTAATCEKLPAYSGALGGWGGAIGCAAVFADVIDAFRRGEENTIPLPSELTISEVVIMDATYLSEPNVGAPYSAEVTWTFTRYTTGNTYTYGPITEIMPNEHYASSDSITTEKSIYYIGDDIVITARLWDCDGLLISGTDAFVHANIETGSITSINVFLRDDGHKGDAIANDGVYTGIYTIQPDDPLDSWDIFVFAQSSLVFDSPAATGVCELEPNVPVVNGGSIDVIPEFTMIAIPVVAILGILFLFSRRKRKE